MAPAESAPSAVSGLTAAARRTGFVGLIRRDAFDALMPGPHCATCQAYEERVMAKAADEALPPEVVPCKDFTMSDRFRDWAVGEMRKEVLGQVRTAGLDRMALLKAKRRADAAIPAGAAEGKRDG